MAIRHKINDWLSILLKVMAICAVIIGLTWFGISIYGNVGGSPSDVPAPPNVSKAQYSFSLKATGQEIYTDEYIDYGNGQYELDGYYELVSGKWKYRDSTLTLDKYYFGDIAISQR